MIPEKVTVLGKKFRVFVEDFPDEEDQIIHGTTDYGCAEIVINETLSENNQDETLLHEVIHIIDENTLQNLDEQQITTLSSCLYDFIRTNKKFIKSLL